MAQIEPRLKGDWKLDSSSEETHFVIQEDGIFQKISSGRVVESGKLRAIDGKWRVNGGSGESGTFSVIGNKLILRGSKSGTTRWDKVFNSASVVSSAPPVSSTARPTGLSATGSSASLTNRTGMTTVNSTAKKNTESAPGRWYNTPKDARRNYSSLTNNLRKTGLEEAGSGESSSTAINSAPVNQVGEPSSHPSLNIEPSSIAAGGNLVRAAQSISRGNITGALNNIFGAAKQSYGTQRNNLQNVSGGNSGAGSGYNPPIPNLASGRGTFSSMREAYQNQMLGSMPAAQPMVVDPNADETVSLGLSKFETKAFGPPKLVRIKVRGVLPR